MGFSETTTLFMEKIEDKLRKLGHIVINPWKLISPGIFDEVEEIYDLRIRSEKLHRIDMKIGRKNREAIDSCDIIFAILDGPDVDSGTASEIGYGFGKGKTIIGYRNDSRQTGENEGCIVNLQVQYWIEECGGKIIRDIREISDKLLINE